MALENDPAGRGRPEKLLATHLAHPARRSSSDITSIRDLTTLKHAQINNLIEALGESAWRYLPVSYLIGKQKAKDLGHPLSTSAADDEANIARALSDNKSFLETSLRPAMEREMLAATSPAEVVAILEKFTSRAEMYGDYVWQVYQAGYKDNLDPEVLLEFFGPDDDHTCDTCSQRVANSPYPASQAPTPGVDCECLTNCRHDLVPEGAIPRMSIEEALGRV